MQLRLFTIFVIIAITTILLIIRIANGQEVIERAYLNPAGQLVVSHHVTGWGVVEDSHTVVLSVREPQMCSVRNDPDKLWFFFESLLIEREPIREARRICPDWDFVKRKCRRKK